MPEEKRDNLTLKGLSGKKERVFACGADVKNRFSFFADNTLHQSEDNGDLALADNFTRYLSLVNQMKKKLNFIPETIAYDLPKNSDVTFFIYDITGRLIETLVNKQQPAGQNTVQWDASKYRSGIYFYRIQAGDFQQVRKMMLIK